MAEVIVEAGGELGARLMANTITQAMITATVNRILDRHMAELRDEKRALAATLREVGAILFGPKGRAMQHIDHFIAGSEAEITIPLEFLLKEDKTVRERVVNETYRRVLGVKTVREKMLLIDQLKGRVSLVNPSGIDPVISIFQANYSKVDWWGALGTYEVRLEPFGALSSYPSAGIGVILTAKNRYRWHPKEDRISKRVHEIADRLERLGGAKSFDMRSPPHTMVVDKSRAGLLHWTTLQQTNPKGERPISRDQLEKLFKKWL